MSADSNQAIVAPALDDQSKARIEQLLQCGLADLSLRELLGPVLSGVGAVERAAYLVQRPEDRPKGFYDRSLAVLCAAIFIIETATARGPLSLPVNPDGEFELPTGWEMESVFLMESLVDGSSWTFSAGDGGPALDGNLDGPGHLAIDASGNVYVVDGHYIRKIDAAGIITTYAGTGEPYSGDGGPATEAQLEFPTELAVDAAGNVYIADQGRRRIRKVDAAGIITTFAGSRFADCSGGDGGIATMAKFSRINGLAVDAHGTVYVSEGGNAIHRVVRIRKIDTEGVITTVAGTGRWNDGADAAPTITNTFCHLRGLALDAFGNLYFSDDHRIWKLDDEGTATAFAGSLGSSGGNSGPATNASLEGPAGVATDTIGNIYVTEFRSGRVREIDAMGAIPVIAGSGR